MKNVSTLLFVFALFSCGSLATPYQKFTLKGVRTGGYQDSVISAKDNKYFLHFVGNGATKLETAVEYWNRRANEMCPKGFTAENMSAQSVKGEGVSDFYYGNLVIPVKYKTQSPNIQGEITCNS